jgi:hypothetical protein
MNDENRPASGNRWEPAGDQSTDQSTETWVATPEPAPARRSWPSRTRTVIAGGAAAVLLAGGLGGFAIGRAVAGSQGPEGADQRQGVPTGFDRDGDHEGPGFEHGPGPGGPGLGEPERDSEGDETDSSNT